MNTEFNRLKGAATSLMRSRLWDFCYAGRYPGENEMQLVREFKPIREHQKLYSQAVWTHRAAISFWQSARHW